MAARDYGTDELFNKYQRNELKLEDIQEGSVEFELIEKISEDLQREYGVDQGAAQRVALIGYNESGGEIASGKQVSEFLGLDELTDTIKQHVKDVYLDAGIDRPDLDHVSLMSSFMSSLGGAGLTGTSFSSDPSNPFSFLDGCPD